MKIYLMAGHGGKDVGATGNGYQEAKIARQFNTKLAKYLKKCGASVGQLSHSKDPYIETLNNKGVYSINKSYDLVIETHLNGFGDKSANGTEVLIASGLKADKYDNAILKVLSNYFKNRGIKSNIPTTTMNVAKDRGLNYRLIELCFISNKTDITVLVKNMDKIAKEMAEAITGRKADSVLAQRTALKKKVTWFKNKKFLKTKSDNVPVWLLPTSSKYTTLSKKSKARGYKGEVTHNGVKYYVYTNILKQTCYVEKSKLK